jgi:hypothetical protein
MLYRIMRTPALLICVGVSLALASTAAAQDDAGRASQGADAKKKAGKASGGDTGGEASMSDDAKAEKKTKPGTTTKSEEGPEVVEVKEGQEGEKTYKFGAVEVAGRLKTPQIIYFLRRVRAEFRAGLLGHRSFMLELSDTRRHKAFR